MLYVGGGGYTLPRHIEAAYPNARQEIMEIDPGVTQTVYEQLGVDPRTTNIITYNGDGRLMLDQLLLNNEGKFDLTIAKNGPYWRSPTAFLRLLDAWRRDARLDGLEVVGDEVIADHSAGEPVRVTA